MVKKVLRKIADFADGGISEEGLNEGFWSVLVGEIVERRGVPKSPGSTITPGRMLVIPSAGRLDSPLP